MKFNRITVEKRCRDPKDFPRSILPEVAFAGRSNVGKSSLINNLLNRKGLVKVSSQPGKTRSIDFFLVNDRFRLVDLPGYGYAKVSKQMRTGWKLLIDSYLKQQKHLVSVVWILDLRREPSEQDRMLEEWLQVYGIPFIPVCTKADKIPFSQRAARAGSIASSLSSAEKPILYSSRTGLGKQELWKKILEAVSSFSPDAGAPPEKGGVKEAE